MAAQITTLAGSALLIAALAAATPGAAAQSTAQGRAPARGAALNVDKPLRHIGDIVSIKGTGFTGGASVAIYLHGPFDSGMGALYGRVKVAADGTFVDPIRLSHYPDKAAWAGHEVMIAALSSASAAEGQEGASAIVQVDPIFSTNITAKGRLLWSRLVLDGTEVHTMIAALPNHVYRLRYPGYLRGGVHSAYLKWKDATGATGAQVWNFRVGSPYVAYPDRVLTLSAASVRVGGVLQVSGRYWTAGADVTIRAGGLNVPPGSQALGRAKVDSQGNFDLAITIPAKLAGPVMVVADASGTAIGDLPEGAAAPVTVSP